MDPGQRHAVVLLIGFGLGVLATLFVQRLRRPKPNLQFVPVSVRVEV